jgi:prepilin-type N-terminal cleavage/methylation domain-containing protein
LRRAFTLTELLVVIALIGVLALASVPAVRSLSRTNTVSAGNRQMLDELFYARQSAISQRRTVYLVFVPPTMRGHFRTIGLQASKGRPLAWVQQQLRSATNLITGQYTAYALFSRRTVGDQPGQPTARYLTPWRHLPEGVLMATNKFVDLGDQWVATVDTVFRDRLATNRPLPFAAFPFPASDSPELRLPYVAFDPLGHVVYDQGRSPAAPDALLTLSRGSIFYPKNPATMWAYDLTAPPDVVQPPASRRLDTCIRVNWLTGRARIEEVKLP